MEGLAERLTATVEVSRNYRSFSGLTDGMDGAVRFIYRTEPWKRPSDSVSLQSKKAAAIGLPPQRIEKVFSTR